jgi:hypothetical protein
MRDDAKCTDKGVRGLRANEFTEAADFALFGPVLIEKCQILLVELVEKLLPAERLERVFAAEAGKIDAHHVN